MAKSKRNSQADAAYNARRRYGRAGVDYLKRARETSGATAARYMQLAKTQYENAVKTYGNATPTRVSANIQALMDEFDIDRRTFNYRMDEGNIRTPNQARYIEQSVNVLQGSLADADVRREAEARALLNDDTIGSRILGGLVDVWRDKATVTDDTGMTRIDNKKIVPALLDYFKVGNLADMIEKLEEAIGSSLYDLKGNVEDIYEYVRLTIAEKVRDNTLVQ